MAQYYTSPWYNPYQNGDYRIQGDYDYSYGDNSVYEDDSRWGHHHWGWGFGRPWGWGFGRPWGWGRPFYRDDDESISEDDSRQWGGHSWGWGFGRPWDWGFGRPWGWGFGRPWGWGWGSFFI